MLDEEFDTLLFAHSEPAKGTGRDLLSAFLAQEPAAQPS